MARLRLLILLAGCFLMASAAWADDVGYVDCTAHPDATQVFSKARQTPDVVATVACGERFTVLVYGFVFSRVSTRDGKIGYIYSSVITIDHSPNAAAQASARSSAAPAPAPAPAAPSAPVATAPAAAVSQPAPQPSSAAQAAPAPVTTQAAPAPTAAPAKPGSSFPTPPPMQVTPSDSASAPAQPAPAPAPPTNAPAAAAPAQPSASPAADSQPAAASQPSAPAQPGPLFPTPPPPTPAAPDAQPAPPSEQPQPAAASASQPQPEAAQPAAEPVREASTRSSWERPVPGGRRQSYLLDLFSGYSFARFVSGGTATNLNGAMGSFGYNLKPWLQIVGDTSYNFVTVSGAKSVIFGNHFGPRFYYRNHFRWNVTPFVEGLVGGSRLDVTVAGAKASQNCISYKAGGGLDVRVGQRWEVRLIDVDYYRTSFGAGGYSASQNSYWASAGIVLRLFGTPGE